MTIPSLLFAVDELVKAQERIHQAQSPTDLQNAYMSYSMAAKRVQKEAMTIDLVPENPK